ncbi:MAG: GNAT family N-acetyltransferase [Desulfobacteraceae bacterium]|nr:MAG: GNAT family N-acetyltransferase [Desulfobacteraceae bacterium]
MWNTVREETKTGNLQVLAIDDLQDLSFYADEWNRLAIGAPQRIPTLSHAWAASFFESMLLPGESWVTLMALEGKMLIGVLPVVISPNRILGLSRPRIRTPYNDHSFSVDFLAAGGREQEVLPLLMASLIEWEPKLYMLSLNRLPENSPTLPVSKSGMAKTTVVHEFNGFGSYLKIKDSFESYRMGLSRDITDTLKRRGKRLARLGQVHTAVIRGGPGTGESEIARFMKLEKSGWKGRSGSAIELSPVLVSFYSALVSRLGRLGWLEWYFLTVGDRTIAGQLSIRMGRTLLLLKTGYDEQFAEFSPGNLLFEKIIERAFREEDTDEINCLSEIAWNDKWAMQKRPHYNIWIYPRRPLPWLFGAIRQKTRIGLKGLPAIPGAYRRIRELVKGGGANVDKKRNMKHPRKSA